MKRVIRRLEVGFRQASLERAQMSEKSERTITLTWSTGSKGLRSAWDGQYYEELSMDPKHVDMSRLQASAPLIASHDTDDLNAVIGVVEKAWLENGKGRATVRFSEDPEADRIFKKVQEGVLNNVSIGYMVRQYTDVSKKDEKVRTLRATNWQPYEISLVAIPFDKDATIRNQSNPLNEVEILMPNEAEEIMSEKKTDAVLQNEIRSMEKARQEEIRKAVRSAKLEESIADQLINDDVSADQARAIVLEKLSAKTPEVISSVARLDAYSQSNHLMRQAGLQDALLHRLDSKNFGVTQLSRELTNKSLVRQLEYYIPRESLESDSRYVVRAMSTSDLPMVLGNVAEKALQKQYELNLGSHKIWTRSDTTNNYKSFSQHKVSDYPTLIERAEGAEFQYGSLSEEKESTQVKDYGRIVSFTSQMIVNDDLGALQRMASGQGMAAARLDNVLAYQALLSNKVMSDGSTLFHASHGNLGTAGAINETTVAEAYKLMMKQKSVGQLDNLNLEPKFLICGPDKAIEARKFLASIVPNQTSNVNPFSGSMQLIVDAEITGNQWYLAASPSAVDTVTLYRVAGQESPIIESRIHWETNSLQLKVAYNVVAAPMDYRGLFKNAGN